MDTSSTPAPATPFQMSAATVALIYFEGSGYIPGTTVATPPRSYFAQLLSFDSEKLVLRMTEHPETGSVFYAKLCSPDGTAERMLKLSGAIVMADPDPPHYNRVEAKIRPVDTSEPFEDPDKWYDLRGPRAGDYRFLSTTSLIRSVPPDAVCPLLNSLIPKTVRAGERFIHQGDPGDVVYLIQQGVCAAIVEQNNQVNTVARLREGDLVGEMAILTGEKRTAHVEAETDMRLWTLDKGRFEALAALHPELRIFLTDLVSHWFDTHPVTAQRKIGKYIITDSVGSGGYSIVYKGFHQNLNIPVAVKMMKHDMAMDPDFIANFHQEAKTIAGFKHENIIKVYDIEERYQTVFIIMEYLEGRSLRSELNTLMRLPSKAVVQYLLQVCNGLHYAHERRIVHQDIKPGNIFLLPGGRIKILDFGLACRCGSEGHFTGTPYYMSPEQIECLPIDERSDIYALGIMTYELLAGRRPYPEDDPHQMLDLRMTADIPDPVETIPDLPEELRNFILKACARDPEQRYRNIHEVMEDLQPLAARLGFSLHLPAMPGRKMATLLLSYGESEQAAVHHLLKEFRNRIGQIEGVALKFRSIVED